MPSHTLAEYQAMITDSLPPDFIRDSLRIIIKASKIAQDACASLRAKVRRSALANYRRAWVEQMWLELGKKYPSLQMGEPDNRSGTAAHVRVRGGRVLLTENAVADSSELPRDADFRSTYARAMQTTFLVEDDLPPPDAILYAMLLYGPSNAAEPHFASIIVPDKTCSQIILRLCLNDVLLELKREATLVAVGATIIATASAAPREELVEDELSLSLKATEAADEIRHAPAQAHERSAETVSASTEDDLDSAQPEKEELTGDVQLSLFDWGQKQAKSGNDNDAE